MTKKMRIANIHSKRDPGSGPPNETPFRYLCCDLATVVWVQTLSMKDKCVKCLMNESDEWVTS